MVAQIVVHNQATAVANNFEVRWVPDSNTKDWTFRKHMVSSLGIGATTTVTFDTTNYYKCANATGYTSYSGRADFPPPLRAPRSPVPSVSL